MSRSSQCVKTWGVNPLRSCNWAIPLGPDLTRDRITACVICRNMGDCIARHHLHVICQLCCCLQKILQKMSLLWPEQSYTSKVIGCLTGARQYPCHLIAHYVFTVSPGGVVSLCGRYRSREFTHWALSNQNFDWLSSPSAASGCRRIKSNHFLTSHSVVISFLELLTRFHKWQQKAFLIVVKATPKSLLKSSYPSACIITTDPLKSRCDWGVAMGSRAAVAVSLGGTRHNPARRCWVRGWLHITSYTLYVALQIYMNHTVPV